MKNGRYSLFLAGFMLNFVECHVCQFLTWIVYKNWISKMFNLEFSSRGKIWFFTFLQTVLRKIFFWMLYLSILAYFFALVDWKNFVLLKQVHFGIYISEEVSIWVYFGIGMLDKKLYFSNTFILEFVL